MIVSITLLPYKIPQINRDCEASLSHGFVFYSMIPLSSAPLFSLIPDPINHYLHRSVCCLLGSQSSFGSEKSETESHKE